MFIKKTQRSSIGILNLEGEFNTQVVTQETQKKLHIVYKEKDVHVS